MNRLRALWWRMTGGLWFVPSVIVVGAAAAAVALIELEGALDLSLAERWPRVFGAGAEGARGMLSAIAGSMITVAGVIFSVTLVALSLAASQYSPRVLRTFMGDRPTQVVLGVFVGVFAYCLVVLRTIRGGDEQPFLPSLAVLGGIVLAFVGIGFLVFFIHHLATAIEASSILERVTAATRGAIDALFPQSLGEEADEDERQAQAAAAPREWTMIPAARSGYIIAVDSPGLLDFARRHRRVLRMERGVGEFVIEGQPIAALAGSEGLERAACRELNALYSLDRQRTIEQDPAFGLQQIVDVALKALSPGINDQTTAVMCIDRLAELLVCLAGRRIETPYRTDGEALRVIAVGPTFAGLTAQCLDAILESAGEKQAVLKRLLWAVDQARAVTRDPGRAQVLDAHAAAIAKERIGPACEPVPGLAARAG